MRAILPTGLLVLAVVGTALAATPAPQPPARAIPDPVEGSRLFVAKGCVTCHAVDGQGGKIGPDLGRVSRGRTLLGMAAIMWNHSPGMTERIQEVRVSRPKLSSREMADLLAFLNYTGYFDPPGIAGRGEELFRDKGCARCHAVGEKGSTMGPRLDRFKRYVSPIVLASAMWNHGPRMATVMAQMGIARPELRGSDIADLLAYIRVAGRGGPEEAAYLLPGNAQAGGRLFQEKQCATCHAIRGVGGGVGPDLTKHAEQLHRSVSQVAASMWNHGPTIWQKMREMGISVPVLSGQEMADIVAFLYVAHYLDEPGSAARGGRVFREKGCQTCHAARGQGGTVGPDLGTALAAATPMDVATAMWNHGAAMETQARARGLAWPQLSGRDLADLLEYVRAPRP